MRAGKGRTISLVSQTACLASSIVGPAAPYKRARDGVTPLSMDRKPRLLVIGPAMAATGFSRVVHGMLENLTHHYEIHHFAINYFGKPPDSAWSIHPNQARSDLYGMTQVGPLVEQIRPHLILLVHDLWIIPVYTQALKHYRGQLRMVAYCPVEGPIRRADIVAGLADLDRLIVYNRFAKDAVSECMASIREKRPDFVFPTIGIIPHGVDRKTFYPYPDGDIHHLLAQGRVPARLSLFGNQTEHRDSFIVLNANRNQPRKRIDITVKGFSLFARNKPKNIKLYLHTELGMQGRGLYHLVRNYISPDRVITTTTANGHPSVSDEKLNLIYNACDVGINTATGEGWGLISFEHAATGAAQIVPGHGAGRELWEGAAKMLDAVDNPRSLNLGFIEKLVSPEGVAAVLESLYQDREHLKEMSIAAYQRATQPEYQWDNIGARWQEVFEDTLSGAS